MQAINELFEIAIREFNGEVGIGFKNLKTGEEYFYNGNRRFIAASTFKVPVLVEFYNQVLNGKLNPNDKYVMKEEDIIFGSGVIKELKPGLSLSLREYATLMMIVSDNTATDIIVDIVGKDNVNKTMEELGLTNTKVKMTCKELLYDAIGIKPTDDEKTMKEKLSKLEMNYTAKCFIDFEDNNVTSPADMLKILDMVYNHKVLDDAGCDAIIDIMRRCQTNERIPRYLPNGTRVAHKTGTIGGIANDVGIVFTDKGDYILVVYTSGPVSEYAFPFDGFDFIAKLSRKVYDHVVADGCY